jgi:exoribonuclease R
MTTYLTMLCISVASAALDEVCMPINSQDLCAAGMERAVAELYPTYGLNLYVGCKKTNIVTTSPRPRQRPQLNLN